MHFYTNNKLQVEIKEDGQVRIEKLKNESKQIVCADKNGTLVLCNALEQIDDLKQQLITLQNKISEMEKLMALK